MKRYPMSALELAAALHLAGKVPSIFGLKDEYSIKDLSVSLTEEGFSGHNRNAEDPVRALCSAMMQSRTRWFWVTRTGQYPEYRVNWFELRACQDASNAFEHYCWLANEKVLREAIQEADNKRTVQSIARPCAGG